MSTRESVIALIAFSFLSAPAFASTGASESALTALIRGQEDQLALRYFDESLSAKGAYKIAFDATYDERTAANKKKNPRAFDATYDERPKQKRKHIKPRNKKPRGAGDHSP